MRTLGAFLLLLTVTLPGPVRAVSRSEALVRARTYAEHPWHCGPDNLAASCSPAYGSVYQTGDYVGLPYDWGGYVTLHEFDLGIADGLGAGSYPDDGVLGCTVGHDCSGFVSRVWKTGHYSTSTMDNISHVISASDVEPADAFNIPGYHIKLFELQQANGDPRFVEAAGYNVHVTFWDSWSSINGYTPIRFDSITDANPWYSDGTADQPVTVGSFPYVQERNTELSLSDMFDVCLGAAPSKGEYGPEIIYHLDLSQPGTVTAAVQDEGDTDVDVHLYRALNESDCFARNDKVVSAQVDCGTLYVVADSYTSASTGVDHPGPFTITIDFEPGTTPCGTAGPPYDPGGSAGEPCGYPGNPNLPFCNPNLGGVVCLYTTGPSATSFCTYPCVENSDCNQPFPGGCCQYVDADLGKACHPSSFCPPPIPDKGPPPADEDTPDTGPVPDEAPTEPIPDVSPFDPGSTGPDSGWDAATGDPGSAGTDGTVGPGYDPGVSPAPDTGDWSDARLGQAASGCTASSHPASPWISVLLCLSMLGGFLSRQRHSVGP